MTQQTINIGSAAEDHTGDGLRAGGDKINDNFTELYARGAFGSNVITVGVGGMASNMADADTLRQALTTFTTIATFTGSSQAYADTRYIVADSGTPLSAYIGKHVAVQAGANTPYLRGTVMSSSQIQLEHRLYTTVTSQTITVATYQYACIFVLPGNDIAVDTPITRRPFTVYAGVRGSSILRMWPQSGISTSMTMWAMNEYTHGAFGYIIGAASYPNEVYLHGLTCLLPHGDTAIATGHMFFDGGASSSGSYFAAQESIIECDIYAGYNDGIFTGSQGTTNMIGGGMLLKNSRLVCGWDAVRVIATRKLHIQGSEILSYGANTTVSPIATSCVALGSTTTGTPMATSGLYLIEDSQLESQAFDYAGGTATPDASAIEIRKRMATSETLIVKNSTITARANNGTASAYGIYARATGAGAETPAIHAFGNEFKITEGGSGVANPMASANANYSIRQANNYAFGGGSSTNGSNVSALTPLT